MVDLFDHKVVFVVGKGGVGRTTVSLALARAAALLGKRVLLAELEEPSTQEISSLARPFGRRSFEDYPEQLEPGLEGVMIRTETGTAMFLKTIFRSGTMVNLAMRSKALLRFLHAAPSLHELGLFYHLLRSVKQVDDQGRPVRDLVIVDMPSTGHTMALTTLPAVLLRLVPSGPIARAMREGQEFFYNPSLTAALVVTLPETLPVTEALELIQGLESTSIPVAGVVMNRVPEDPFTVEERAALEEMIAPGQRILGLRTMTAINQTAEAIGRARRSTRYPVRLLGELPVAPSELAVSLAQVIREEWI